MPADAMQHGNRSWFDAMAARLTSRPELEKRCPGKKEQLHVSFFDCAGSNQCSPD
jgi:hypothetical protein